MGIFQKQFSSDYHQLSQLVPQIPFLTPRGLNLAGDRPRGQAVDLGLGGQGRVAIDDPSVGGP